MTSGRYVQDLERQLAEVDANLEKAMKTVERRAPEGKPDVLAELTRLKQRHKELVERVVKAKNEGSSDWSTLHTSFREQIDALADTLESFLTGYA